MSVLTRIIEARRRRLVDSCARVSLEEIRERAQVMPVRGGFAAALASGTANVPAVIAELKRASPSTGRIRDDFQPDKLAGELAAAGARALSILTERDFFGGDDAFISQARSGAGAVPLLRKDFILEPWQVWESRALGADAVLLMVEVLDDAALSRLLGVVEEAGLAALVETNDAGGVGRAIRAGAAIIGINARNLTDFSVDLSRSEELARLIPDGIVRVAESGVHDARDLARLRRAGFDAALVGTALMRASAPGDLLRQWLTAAPGRS